MTWEEARTSATKYHLESKGIPLDVINQTISRIYKSDITNSNTLTKDLLKKAGKTATKIKSELRKELKRNNQVNKQN